MAGETIEIFVPVKNYGSETATAVTGSISTTSELLSISPSGSVVSYGDISSGQIVNADEPFVLSLDQGLSDHSDLELLVTFNDGQGNTFNASLDVNVAGNSIFASDLDVLGTTNDILYPGQSSFVKIQLQNLGSTIASSVVGTITSASPFIDILDNTGTWSSIGTGSVSFNNNDYFEIRTLDGNHTWHGCASHIKRRDRSGL